MTSAASSTGRCWRRVTRRLGARRWPWTGSRGGRGRETERRCPADWMSSRDSRTEPTRGRPAPHGPPRSGLPPARPARHPGPSPSVRPGGWARRRWPSRSGRPPFPSRPGVRHHRRRRRRRRRPERVSRPGARTRLRLPRHRRCPTPRYCRAGLRPPPPSESPRATPQSPPQSPRARKPLQPLPAPRRPRRPEQSRLCHRPSCGDPTEPIAPRRHPHRTIRRRHPRARPPLAPRSPVRTVPVSWTGSSARSCSTPRARRPALQSAPPRPSTARVRCGSRVWLWSAGARLKATAGRSLHDASIRTAPHTLRTRSAHAWRTSNSRSRKRPAAAASLVAVTAQAGEPGRRGPERGLAARPSFPH